MLIQNFIPTRFLKSALWEGHTTSKDGKQVPGPSPRPPLVPLIGSQVVPSWAMLA